MTFIYPETIDEFRSAIMNAGTKKTLVQVSASWCGPCTLIKDDMAALAEEFDSSYVFVYCDVDKLEEIQELFEIASMPTFLIFKGPGVPTRYAGGQFAKIREFVETNKDS